MPWTMLRDAYGASHMEAVAADHLENWAEDAHPKRSAPELGYPEPLKHWDEVGKGRLVAKIQDVGALVDSVGVPVSKPDTMGAAFAGLCQMLNSACGWDIDKNELLLTGERISNLRRMFSYRRASISRKDDTLPARFDTKVGRRHKGYIPHLGLMLNEYYLPRLKRRRHPHQRKTHPAPACRNVYKGTAKILHYVQDDNIPRKCQGEGQRAQYKAPRGRY